MLARATFATPAIYRDLLRHFASHGFIVVAANATQAGSGRDMLAGLDWVAWENSRSGGVFYGKVDVGKSGYRAFAGWGCGDQRRR
nr:hypothetical protein GCM10017745_18170 [Saccharothrix mutabilis subsp. capreolus]